MFDFLGKVLGLAQVMQKCLLLSMAPKEQKNEIRFALAWLSDVVGAYNGQAVLALHVKSSLLCSQSITG